MYSAAFGTPGHVAVIDARRIGGLATRVADRERLLGDAVSNAARQSIVATFAAILLIAAAVGVSWFAPSAAPTTDQATCLTTDGVVVAKIAGTSVSVRGLAGG